MADTSGYVFYRSPASVASQNRNYVAPSVASEYPRRLYVGEPMGGSYCQPFQYTCPTLPRDPEIEYYFPTERDQHPGHFSRFAYPWCPNGYCTANFPGRYNTPPGMIWQSSALPQGMAPERFYQGAQADSCRVLSEAYIDSYTARIGF